MKINKCMIKDLFNFTEYFVILDTSNLNISNLIFWLARNSKTKHRNIYSVNNLCITFIWLPYFQLQSIEYIDMILYILKILGMACQTQIFTWGFEVILKTNIRVYQFNRENRFSYTFIFTQWLSSSGSSNSIYTRKLVYFYAVYLECLKQ